MALFCCASVIYLALCPYTICALPRTIVWRNWELGAGTDGLFCRAVVMSHNTDGDDFEIVLCSYTV